MREIDMKTRRVRPGDLVLLSPSYVAQHLDDKPDFDPKLYHLCKVITDPNDNGELVIELIKSSDGSDPPPVADGQILWTPNP